MLDFIYYYHYYFLCYFLTLNLVLLVEIVFRYKSILCLQLDPKGLEGKDSCLYSFIPHFHCLTYNMVLGARRAAAFRKGKVPMDGVLRITGICKIVITLGNLADSCQGQRSLLTDRKLDTEQELSFFKMPAKWGGSDPGRAQSPSDFYQLFLGNY